MTDHTRLERATGALIGSVVGDALGAPFEFGRADGFSSRFPSRLLIGPTEMVGGHGWEAAEWTDDTQMALLLAQSLLDQGGLVEADVFDRFRAWAVGGPTGIDPKDIGHQTRRVLRSGLGWPDAAVADFATTGRGAGNGSLMRTVPATLYFSSAGRVATMDAARRISMLTHGDPAAGEGCAIYHELIRLTLDGADPLDHLDEVVDLIAAEHRDEWAARLDPTYEPRRDPVGNGAVWPALGAAIWALRTTHSFEGALRAAVDLGHDTDTVACITGGLAGARYSIGAIPSRWATGLHGDLIGRADSGLDLEALEALARSLLGGASVLTVEPVSEPSIEPALVWDDDLIYAANFPGVVRALDAGRLPAGALVVSLSRTFGRLDSHPSRRQAWLVDQDAPGRNLAIGDVLDDVIDTMEAAIADHQPVVVHCHGGRSRTGLILRAWLLRTQPAMTVAEATAEVESRWNHFDPWNQSFTQALHDWSRRGR